VRLLIISQYFWPEDFRVNDLTSEMVRKGHSVTVLTGLPNYPSGKLFPEFREDPEQFATLDGAKIIRVPHVLRGTSKIRLLANYISFFLSASVCGPWLLRGCKFDGIVVFEISPVTVGIVSSVIRAIKKAPVAFWVLDQWPETLQAVGVTNNKFVLRMVGRLVAFIYRRCDAILAPARTLIPQLANYCEGSTKKIFYFPNWSDPISIDGVVPAPEIGLATGAFIVLFAGNIGVAQDFESILNAAEELRENVRIRWLFVGDGRMSSWVRSEIDRRGLSTNVQMVGRVAQDRMPSFFVPGKLQTYLAAGKPVLAMLNGEGADVVRRANAGLVCDAGDSRGLARIVRSMMEISAAQREQMGVNGRTYCAREFGKQVVIERLEKILVDMKH
jgi:colanic acid biosynthesis glycosyl transferase WcaI